MLTNEERKTRSKMKLAVKTLDVDSYIKLCKENNKIDSFIRDYAKYNHINYQEWQLPYVINMPKSIINSEMIYKLLVNSSDIDEKREAEYFSLLDEKYETLYFKHILSPDFLSIRNLNTKNNRVFINDEIFEEAINQNKVIQLFTIYHFGRNIRKRFIRYIIDNNKYEEFYVTLSFLNEKLSADDLCDYMEMILKIENDSLLVTSLIKKLAEVSAKPYDFNRLRSIITMPCNGQRLFYYIISFKDFDIPDTYFEAACISSRNMDENFLKLSSIEFSTLSAEKKKILLSEGCIGDKNNYLLYLYGYRLDKELVKEVIDELLIDVHPDVITKDMLRAKDSYNDYKIDALSKQDRIAYLLPYLDDSIRDEYMEKLVDSLVSQENYEDYIENVNYNYMDPLKLASKYEIKNKRINDKIVGFIMGNGNEPNINRIDKFKIKINDIKYLDDKNILKLAPYLLENGWITEYFLFHISQITDISILKDMVLNTGNRALISKFESILSNNKYVDSLNQAKNVIK